MPALGDLILLDNPHHFWGCVQPDGTFFLDTGSSSGTTDLVLYFGADEDRVTPISMSCDPAMYCADPSVDCTCNVVRLAVQDPFGMGYWMDNGDCTTAFTEGLWTIEFYYRIPSMADGDTVYLIWQEDGYMNLTATKNGTNIDYEFSMYSALDEFNIDVQDVLVYWNWSGLDDGCWHQIAIIAQQSDTRALAVRYDAIEVAYVNPFTAFDFNFGCWPDSVFFGAMAGTEDVIVDFTHLAFFESIISSNSLEERAALIATCCPATGAPHLRQRQRNDNFNAPRFRGPVNNPSSRQKSLRRSRGSNTYLEAKRQEILAGCGCKS